jgi:hypothetical protein
MDNNLICRALGRGKYEYFVSEAVLGVVRMTPNYYEDR